MAIARALMMEPQVLLFDEPTAALDPEITAQIVSIIRELAETGITQVIVTHEVEVARKTASRVVYMENGHIVEQGDASCFTHPQTDAFKLSFTLMFFGEMMMKKVLIAALLAGMSLSASAAQAIRFATEASYPPFELVDANNQIVGFDVDLANALQKRSTPPASPIRPLTA